MTTPRAAAEAGTTRDPAASARGPARRMAWVPALVLLGWSAAVGQMPLSDAVPGGLTTPVAAVVAVADPGRPGELAGDLESRLAEARAQLAAFGAAGSADVPAGVASHDDGERRALLHRLVLLYEQQLSNAAQLEGARTRKAESAREAQTWTRFSEPRPYSILLTDRLRAEIQAEQQRISNGEATDAARDQLLREHREALTQAEEKIRQLNEQLESTTDPALTARLAWQRQMERLRSQVAVATVALFDSERLVSQEVLARSRIRLGLLRRQCVLAEAGATFTQTDLDQVLSQIERQREQFDRELAEAAARRLAAMQALETARQDARAVPDRPGDSPAASRAMEVVSVRATQAGAADSATYVLRLMLESASLERLMWELRFAAYGTRSVAVLRESRHRLGVLATRLGLWRDYARQQLEGSTNQLQLQEARVTSLPPDSELLPLARQRLDALRERELVLLRFAQTVARLEHLTQRWAEGLRDAEVKLPLVDRVRNLFSDGRRFLQRLWTFEVFTAEDTITVDGQRITGRRGVTTGKIVVALLILVVGYWITGRVTAFAEPIIAQRLKVEPKLADLIRRWLRAALVVCVLLFSLAWVKIPLTVFAFAGGALAIGLGFGTQTVLKNFVSGLILLFERPFRVGDVLDVGGQKGTVTSIGLRASVLQLFDDTETLIPNSSLLEGNVTNWTYSNSRVRFTVSVGVAYGSEPRRVVQLLGEVAERHSLVAKTPKPQVLFTEFGDSNMAFELRFWVDVIKTNAAQVSSDLRLMIAGAFAENGIVIAFPQRDINLRADQPIPMRVVAPAECRASDPATPGAVDAGDKPGGTS